MVPHAVQLGVTQRVDGVLERYFERVKDHHVDFDVAPHIASLTRALYLKHSAQGPPPRAVRVPITQANISQKGKAAEKSEPTFAEQLLERAKTARLIAHKRGYRLVALTKGIATNPTSSPKPTRANSADSKEAESTDVELPSPGGPGKRGRGDSPRTPDLAVETRAYRVVAVTPPPTPTTAAVPAAKRAKRDPAMAV